MRKAQMGVLELLLYTFIRPLKLGGWCAMNREFLTRKTFFDMYEVAQLIAT
jgi:hypothetical protein